MGKQNYCIVEEVKLCSAKTHSIQKLCKFYRATPEITCKHKEDNFCRNPSASKDAWEKLRQKSYSRQKITF